MDAAIMASTLIAVFGILGCLSTRFLRKLGLVIAVAASAYTYFRMIGF